MASWSDISIIYSFYRHYTQSANLDESEKLKIGSGLNIFFKDDYNENSPDFLYSR